MLSMITDNAKVFAFPPAPPPAVPAFVDIPPLAMPPAGVPPVADIPPVLEA
jgi:hypothetical protein